MIRDRTAACNTSNLPLDLGFEDDHSLPSVLQLRTAFHSQTLSSAALPPLRSSIPRPLQLDRNRPCPIHLSNEETFHCFNERLNIFGSSKSVPKPKSEQSTQNQSYVPMRPTFLNDQSASNSLAVDYHKDAKLACSSNMASTLLSQRSRQLNIGPSTLSAVDRDILSPISPSSLIYSPIETVVQKALVSDQKAFFAFLCQYCDEGFNSREERRVHIATYHPRPHVCSICLHRFSRKYDLRKHISTVHKRLRPFRCDVCNRSFGQKHHLTRHKNCLHSIVKMNKAVSCSHASIEKESLENYLNPAHRLPFYRCMLCDMGCRDVTWLFHHLKQVHMVEASKIRGILAASENCWVLEA